MANSLKIVRPNGKEYNIPITAIGFTGNNYYDIDSTNFKTYTDLIPVYELLELPTEQYTGQVYEEWTINNVSVPVRITNNNTANINYNDFPNNLEINKKLNTEVGQQSLQYSNTSICYDYVKKVFTIVSGVQGYIPTDIYSNSEIYKAKPVYTKRFFEGGVKITTEKEWQVNVLYMTDPFTMKNKKNKTYTGATALDVSNFFNWLNSQSGVDPIEPSEYPDYPEDEPDPPIPGDGDDESDPIPDPPVPTTWDVTNTGFVVIYNPTVQEIRELAYFMWSGDFTDLIKKMFGSPFEALISLKMIYCPVVTGAAKLKVWLGNVETTVSMSKVVEQFADIDMGTININEYFGSFADYAPYTKIQIYLPFIGYKDLNVDEVMNATLHLRYRVDVYTGSCIAYLTVTKNIKGTALNSILYQFDGNCACEIPFTSNDNSRYVSALLTTAASTALSMAATSGVSTAEPAFMFDKGKDAKLNIGSLAPVANGMLDVLSTKPNIQRAGSLTGSVAAMCIKKPYVIIRRPIAQMPKDYQHYLGIPLNLSMQLSSVTGYTIVSQVFLSSATATDKEIEEITQLLKSGVIL